MVYGTPTMEQLRVPFFAKSNVQINISVIGNGIGKDEFGLGVIAI